MSAEREKTREIPPEIQELLENMRNFAESFSKDEGWRQFALLFSQLIEQKIYFDRNITGIKIQIYKGPENLVRAVFKQFPIFGEFNELEFLKRHEQWHLIAWCQNNDIDPNLTKVFQEINRANSAKEIEKIIEDFQSEILHFIKTPPAGSLS